MLQGEREFCAQNKSLGRFQLSDIPPAPRGVPQIEVTFDIDAHGIVHVSAKDLGTNKSQSITITSSSNLSEEEIEKAVKEAEQNAADDKKRREMIDAVNELDNKIYQIEKLVKDSADKISEEDKKALEDAVAAAKLGKEETELEKVKAASEALSKVSDEIVSKLYQNAQAEAQNSQAQQSTEPEVEVVDNDENK